MFVHLTNVSIQKHGVRRKINKNQDYFLSISPCQTIFNLSLPPLHVRTSTMIVMEGSGQWTIWDSTWRALEGKRLRAREREREGERERERGLVFIFWSVRQHHSSVPFSGYRHSIWWDALDHCPFPQSCPGYRIATSWLPLLIWMFLRMWFQVTGIASSAMGESATQELPICFPLSPSATTSS